MKKPQWRPESLYSQGILKDPQWPIKEKLSSSCAFSVKSKVGKAAIHEQDSARSMSLCQDGR
jgi:hypothetical protein